MNIQIFGSSKSFDTKKAERWFKERRIKYQYIDVLSKGLSPREYQSVKQKVGFEALVNTKCRAYGDIPKSEQILTTKSDNFCLKRQISYDAITLSIILTTEILSLFCHWCNKLNGFIIIKNERMR